VNTISGLPANSGEPKAMMNLATSFLYIFLMGRQRGMKLVPTAVQTSSSYLAINTVGF